MQSVNELQRRIAHDSIERYSGSPVGDYQPKLLLTNFPSYVELFAQQRQVPFHSGSAFSVAHDPAQGISLLCFGLGSPGAALVVDLIAHLPIQCALLLGMCGGLRRRYQVGDYLIPIASIRGEGTSNFYFPPEVPALANFHMTQACSRVLSRESSVFHFGITHTTNIRFWEFDEPFKENLKATRAQAIEMECATLFTASYKRGLTLGALLLISDLPLEESGVKTKESSRRVLDLYSTDHLNKGVLVMEEAGLLIQAHEERKRHPRPPTMFHRMEPEETVSSHSGSPPPLGPIEMSDATQQPPVPFPGDGRDG